jgi:hypothetical protein
LFGRNISKTASIDDERFEMMMIRDDELKMKMEREADLTR